MLTGSARWTDLPIPQRFGGIQQPPERIAQLRRRRTLAQIAFDVFDRARQDVELVVQCVELLACHHEFVLAQLEFPRALPSNPVPLSAPLRTEHPGPAWASLRRQRTATPSTVPGGVRCSAPLAHAVFRHDELIVESLVPGAAGLGDFRTVTLPAPPTSAFASDNAAGAHPAVLDAIARANSGHALAYGDDAHTRECSDRFRDLFGVDVTTRLTFNGTGANVLALATLLGALPGAHHGIVCTDWAHIAVDETGAPDRVLGAKLIDLPSEGGKLVPEQLVEAAAAQGVQHHVQPGVVSITQATELGTLYTPEEVAALCDQAHALGMLVHLDGARIANATAALGASRSALRSLTVDAGVDAVSFGGTKNGLLGAEAVVFLDPACEAGSKYVRKQVTQLPSKMRYLAAQFNAVLHDDLWISLAAHSNSMATELHRSTVGIAGVELGDPPAVNSVFPRLPPDCIAPLRDWCFFWDWDTTRHEVRWMTAWDTTIDDVRTFAAGVEAIVGGRATG